MHGARVGTWQICANVSKLTLVASGRSAPHDLMMSHSPLVLIAAGVLVFALAALSDYVEALYVKAVNARDAQRAAGCSVLMWLSGVIWLGALLEVGWWVVLPEGAGLYIGTLLAMRDKG